MMCRPCHGTAARQYYAFSPRYSAGGPRDDPLPLRETAEPMAKRPRKKRPKLGEILVRDGVVAEEQIEKGG